jgi:hypothetical protein
MPCCHRWAVKRTSSRQLVLQIHGTACARVQEDLLYRRRRKRVSHGGHLLRSYPHMMRLPFLLPNVLPWVCLDDLVHIYKCIFAHILGQVHHCQHAPLLEAYYDHNGCRPRPHWRVGGIRRMAQYTLFLFPLFCPCTYAISACLSLLL